MPRPGNKIIVALAFLAITASLAAQQNTSNERTRGVYTVTDLVGLAGTRAAQATAINDLGQVVGKSADHAFLWEHGSMTDLGTLGGTASSANAINDRGQIVGESETVTGEIHAFLWQAKSMTDLGIPGETSSAHGINNQGEIVGASFAKNVRGGAVVWENGNRHALGDLGTSGSGSTAMAINDRGAIVGVSSGFAAAGGGVIRAVVWQNGTIKDIGTLGGVHSTANALDNGGDIVGWAELDTQATAAFVWKRGSMQQLPNLPNGLLAPGTGTEATATNDRGQIVGSALNSNGQSRAVLWENGKITDLNDVSGSHPGVIFTRATGINNHGQIVVEEQTSDQAPRSFLLTP